MALNSKRDFSELMFTILNPLKSFYSAGCARLDIGDTGATYYKEAIELEAFSRPLWALAPFWAGGGSDEDFERIYRMGLASGTEPDNPEYWGGFNDYDQRFVEMAAIACSLLISPEKTWEPLADSEKENLAAWLVGINRYVIPKCNWQFFRVLVNLALKYHGMDYSEEKLEESLNEIESYYLGGGWYRDGASSQKDYYISFAMHYYGLIYARLMKLEDPARSEKYKARALEFARDFIYWFAEDGSALPFGRSLTYRFAQVSFWSACLFAGIEPYPVDVIKGMIVRHLEYWQAQRIFDRDGVLTIGYAYPNLIMSERYNAPGSPYWGMKSFLVLALPDGHPFWAAKPAALPELESIKPLPHADMLIHRRENDVTAYAAGVCELYGHGQTAQKYSKFAYSTAFGFSVARSSFVLNEACPDSMLAFIIDDTVFVRKGSRVWEISGDGVYSEWSPFPGIAVKTVIKPTETGHIRRHEIDSDYDCLAVDCGFAVPKFTEPGYLESVTDTAATVETDVHMCAVNGKGPDARPEVINADPNTNILFPNTSIPCVRYTVAKGRTQIETTIACSHKLLLQI